VKNKVWRQKSRASFFLKKKWQELCHSLREKKDYILEDTKSKTGQARLKRKNKYKGANIRGFGWIGFAMKPS
jgi:hypothetical protein